MLQANTGEVLGGQVRRAEDALLGVDVGDDLVDLLGRVAEAAQRPRDRLVDDRHVPAADELLELDEPEVGLDAGGVAVHQERDRPGRGEHRGLAVAHAVLLAVAHRGIPRLAARRRPRRRARPARVDRVRRVAVHPQHVEHVRLVLGEPGERAHPAGRAGAGGVGVAGHQRGQRRGPCPALGRVVGQTERHQQRPEVGVAEAELAERPGGLADLLRRVVGPADEDLLGGEHHLDGVPEALDVEAVVVAEELEQVDRRQVARRVVEVDVLASTGWSR